MEAKPTGFIDMPITMVEHVAKRFAIESSGCWRWTGYISKQVGQGYGSYRLGNRLIRAHRGMYELVTGKIVPSHLVIDHLCRNRACINPKHLEVVTTKTNVLRGMGYTAQNGRKTHCSNGHELTPDNVYLSRLGRVCKTCRGWHQKRRKEHIQERMDIMDNHEAELIAKITDIIKPYIPQADSQNISKEIMDIFKNELNTVIGEDEESTLPIKDKMGRLRNNSFKGSRNKYRHLLRNHFGIGEDV